MIREPDPSASSLTVHGRGGRRTVREDAARSGSLIIATACVPDQPGVSAVTRTGSVHGVAVPSSPTARTR